MIIFYIVLFFLGTVFGSFGGVAIERGEEGFARDSWKEVFGGRSFCPGCKGKLLVRWQLIPLIGWLLQKGKCFRCKKKIPGWYCLIELLMGCVFVVTGFVFFGSIPLIELLMLPGLAWVSFGFWLLLSWGLVCLIIADMKFYQLNMYIWFILFCLVLLYYLLLSVIFPVGYVIKVWLVPGLVGMLALTTLFELIYITAKWYATKKFGKVAEGIGMGDVIMAILIGLLSPFVINTFSYLDIVVIIQLIFVYLILSSLLGIIYRMIENIFSTKKTGRLPFLPAMIVAFWVLLAWGESIVSFMNFGGL